jgi:uncharacterized protein
VLLCTSGLIPLDPVHLLAQSHPNSPVFKDYRSPGARISIEQSDATYQMWEGFLVARKANAGDVLAQHELGIRYLTGRGFEADTAKAAYWIGKAAEQNLLTARFNLGILLYNGWGIEWNPFEAYRDFFYCAQEHMVQAQYILGQFLTDNLVVSRNWDEAYRWVKMAADSGYAPARDALAVFEKRGHGPSPASPQSSTNAPARGDSTHLGSGSPFQQPLGLVFLDFAEDTASRPDDLTLLKEALRGGTPEAAHALGGLHAPGDSVAIDSIGLRSFQPAAEIGSPEALALIGWCYERGKIVKNDPVLAAVYYLRAIRFESARAGALLSRLIQETHVIGQIRSRAERGDPDAQYAAAAMFALGYDPFVTGGLTRLTEGTALHFLRNAARQEHVQALIELGLCYYAGRWVPQDQSQALRYWNEAARLGSREAEVRIAVTQVRTHSASTRRDEDMRVLMRAAEEGSILAEVALAYCYETGNPARKGEAAKLYRSSAQRGSQDAYRALKRMHDEIRPDGWEYSISE